MVGATDRVAVRQADVALDPVGGADKRRADRSAGFTAGDDAGGRRGVLFDRAGEVAKALVEPFLGFLEDPAGNCARADLVFARFPDGDDVSDVAAKHVIGALLLVRVQATHPWGGRGPGDLHVPVHIGGILRVKAPLQHVLSHAGARRRQRSAQPVLDVEARAGTVTIGDR